MPLALTPKVLTCLPLPCRAHNFAELGDGAHWEQLMTHLMDAHQPATSPTDKAALEALPRRSVRPDDGHGDGPHHPQEQQVSFDGSASYAGRQKWGWCWPHSSTSQAVWVRPQVQGWRDVGGMGHPQVSFVGSQCCDPIGIPCRC